MQANRTAALALLASTFLFAPLACGGLPVPQLNAQTQTSEPSKDGVYKIGGNVKPPLLIYQVDPDFPETLRRKKVTCDLQIAMVVSEQGIPMQVHIVQSKEDAFNVGAIAAIEQYRYKPATLNGKPVPVDLFIDLNFTTF